MPMFDDSPPMPVVEEVEEVEDMPTLCRVIKDETLCLERALAGYDTMSTLHSQITRGTGENERRKGLPVLSYTGTSDGHNVVEIRVDLRKMPKAWLPGILAPIANYHAHEVVDAARRVYEASGRILREAEAALSANENEQPPG